MDQTGDHEKTSLSGNPAVDRLLVLYDGLKAHVDVEIEQIAMVNSVDHPDLAERFAKVSLIYQQLRDMTGWVDHLRIDAFTAIEEFDARIDDQLQDDAGDQIFGSTLRSLDAYVAAMDHYVQYLEVRSSDETADYETISIGREFIAASLKKLAFLESLLVDKDLLDTDENGGPSVETAGLSQEDLYTKLIDPNLVSEATDSPDKSLEITILNDNTIEVNGQVRQLHKHEMFILNLLLLNRGRFLSRAMFEEAGFYYWVADDSGSKTAAFSMFARNLTNWVNKVSLTGSAKINSGMMDGAKWYGLIGNIELIDRRKDREYMFKQKLTELGLSLADLDNGLLDPKLLPSQVVNAEATIDILEDFQIGGVQAKTMHRMRAYVLNVLRIFQGEPITVKDILLMEHAIGDHSREQSVRSALKGVRTDLREVTGTVYGHHNEPIQVSRGLHNATAFILRPHVSFSERRAEFIAWIDALNEKKIANEKAELERREEAKRRKREARAEAVQKEQERKVERTRKERERREDRRKEQDKKAEEQTKTNQKPLKAEEAEEQAIEFADAPSFAKIMEQARERYKRDRGY